MNKQKIAERSTYQVFDNIPYEFYKDKIFIKDFIQRLLESSISYEDIFAGVIAACEKRSHPRLCKMLLEELRSRRFADNIYLNHSA